MTGLGTRVSDWFNGGSPDGRAKLRQWMRGYKGDADRPEGFTYGMMGPATGLSVLAGLIYPLTKGYGSVVALALAVFLVLGPHMIERQVAGVISDLQEAQRQYKRTRDPEYLEFTDLRASGLLEDNKMLTAPTKAWLAEQIEWAREQKKRNEQRMAKKAARAERRRGRIRADAADAADEAAPDGVQEEKR